MSTTSSCRHFFAPQYEVAIIAVMTLSSLVQGLKPGHLETGTHVAMSVGRMAGALVGPHLWQLGGMLPIGSFCAVGQSPCNTRVNIV